MSRPSEVLVRSAEPAARFTTRRAAEVCRRHVLRSYHRGRTWLRCGYRHSAEIDPYRVIWIDPAEVQLVQPRTTVIPHDWRRCHVVGGDWDLQGTPFDRKPVVVALRAHFVAGTPWEETDWHSTVVGRLQMGGVPWNGCRSEDDVRARCAFLDRLHADLRTKGYRVPSGLASGRSGHVGNAEEIAVGVGRGGTFFHVDGQHRLALAKLVGVRSIPVRVIVRHANWQAHRDEVAVKARRERGPAEWPQRLERALDHPDVRYLVRKTASQP
jgi:hypothetical protein